MVKKATWISRFVTAVEERPIYAGLDVHTKTYPVAHFDPEDGIIETFACPSGAEALVGQQTGLGCQIPHVIYESDPTGFALNHASE